MIAIAHIGDTTLCTVQNTNIWFKAMALYNNKLSRKVYTHDKMGDDFLCNPNVQECALHHINNGQLQNDKQIKAVFEKYKLETKIREQL